VAAHLVEKNLTAELLFTTIAAKGAVATVQG
jgi:hypothetical protein